MPVGLESHLGQLAGVGTSALWAMTSLAFTAAARRIGPLAVNAYRIPLAVVLLAVTHRLLAGTWFPPLLPKQVWFLAASGFIGLSIGDQALFTAFVDIGPRLCTLIMTTSPIFAAAFAWLALGETLSGFALLGITITIAGVAWVVAERPRDPTLVSVHRVRGVVLAIIGSACQAAGLLLSKQGMGHGWLPADERMDPQAATLVRMAFATLGMLPIVFAHRLHRRTRRRAAADASPRGAVVPGLFFASLGAIGGPFLGVWLSLIAADRAPVGVAQTLMSLTPIFILPILVVLKQERISWRATIGAAIAVGGCALLFANS